MIILERMKWSIVLGICLFMWWTIIKIGSELITYIRGF